MTALFQFPRIRHTRQYSPKPYAQYQSFKPYLQREFARVCVYCRQPDSYEPNLSFGIDHYRPKKKFPSLECSYSNLYYCCGKCNSRKKDYWPGDITVGPYVVNPCDHAMGDHIKFNTTTGKVEPRTKFGEFTEELLQLNDERRVTYRRGVLTAIRLWQATIEDLKKELGMLKTALRSKKINTQQFEDSRTEVLDQIKELQDLVSRSDGSSPLPSL